MGNFGRDDRSGGGYRGGSRGGFQSRGRSSGGSRSFDRGGDRGDRPMYKAVCSNCGKDCEVPFRPTNGKPVYCSDCFEKMGNGSRSDAGRAEGSDFRPQPQVSTPNNNQLDALNVKLDKIISLLEPKSSPVVVSEPVVEAKKTPKVKKTASAKKE